MAASDKHALVANAVAKTCSPQRRPWLTHHGATLYTMKQNAQAIKHVSVQPVVCTVDAA